MSKYIVTDLTRFNKEESVCTAIVDKDTGQCFRPLPYLKSQRCKELNIHPGAILEGTLTLKADRQSPHTEDAFYDKLRYLGPCTSDEFKAVLINTLSPSISRGFNHQFMQGDKVIPKNIKPTKSIITIKVLPHQFSIFEDQFKPGKIKCSFYDLSGHRYQYLPITDRGYHHYAQSHRNDGKLAELQRELRQQNEIFLRIGLSREHAQGDRDGYWLQVNGIYTFPLFNPETRTY